MRSKTIFASTKIENITLSQFLIRVDDSHYISILYMYNLSLSLVNMCLAIRSNGLNTINLFSFRKIQVLKNQEIMVKMLFFSYYLLLIPFLSIYYNKISILSKNFISVHYSFKENNVASKEILNNLCYL